METTNLATMYPVLEYLALAFVILFGIIGFPAYCWFTWNRFKCPICKKMKRIVKNDQKVKFGEFEKFECGHEYIPSGAIPFLPLLAELKRKN